MFNSGYAPSWFDGYQVAGKPYFNFVWRPRKRPTKVRRGLNAQDYQAKLKEGIDHGYAPVHVESYRSGSGVRYALIMEKGVKGKYLAKHGLNDKTHQHWFEKAKKLGLNPVNISVVSVNGQRRYTVLYRANGIGSWQVNSCVPEEGYQSLVEAQDKKGRRPRYIAA